MGSGGGASGESAGGPAGSLNDLAAADLAQLRIGATLVVGRWTELGIGGVLWDGARLVTVHPSSGALVARLTRERRPPVSLDLGGLEAAGREPVTGAPIVRLGSGTGQTVLIDAPPAPPRATLRGALPAWVSLVGQLSVSGSRRVLLVEGERVALDDRCRDSDDRAGTGAVAVTGVAVGDPLRLLVPCGGYRAAPSLGSGAGRTGLTDDPAARTAAIARSAEKAPADLRRPLVAGMLVLAAVSLVGGAIVRRRRDPDGSTPAAPSDGEEPGEDAPRLTLVRVPPDGGP
jgi:hypothetical protein